MRVEVIGDATLYCGDCRDVLATLAPLSVDSIVTDPPYGLKFMGKAWDHGVPGVEFWTAALRVAKPGAHLLAFGGTRTFHRLACAIEDAGWEIRDCIMWAYGSGFPKSLDVSKAIDKARTEDVEPIRRICRVLRAAMDARGLKSRDLTSDFGDCDARLIDHWAARDTDSQPALPTWYQWTRLRDLLGIDGRYDEEVLRLELRKGTAGDAWNKAGIIGENPGQTPGFGEKRFTSRDALIREPTGVAREWYGWGTALKPAWEPIIVARKPLVGSVASNVLKYGTGAINIDGCRVDSEKPTGLGGGGSKLYEGGLSREGGEAHFVDSGRWPANLIHDGSDEVVELFPEEFGTSAARFFYCAKASKEDRDEGCDEFDERNVHNLREDGRVWDIPGSHSTHKKNNHPTVKPTDLMRYLVRLVTPPGGTCLDMFMGSGSTGKACKYEGFGFIGIDLEDEHIDIATARIKYADKKAREQPDLFTEKKKTEEREEPTLF